MAKSYTNKSGYCATTAIAKFWNLDEANEVGLEMRMTMREYHELARFIEKAHKDGIESGRQSVADQVRAVLPTGEAK